MNSSKTIGQRLLTLDLLKGVAIVAVMLYHAGLMKYGYLGVDIFLVVSGYLTTIGIVNAKRQDTFNYWLYLRNKTLRLLPLALLITTVSLLGGYFTMLPVAFKNVCETSVGTSFFLNNFVQCIVSSNYWDYSNEIKPLMHTWYIGILFQFYVLYPLLFVTKRKIGNINLSYCLLCIIFVVSVALFFSPLLTTAQKFYLLPARLFEFCLGGIIAVSILTEETGRKLILNLAFLLITILLIIPQDVEPSVMRLLLTTGGTSIVIWACKLQKSTARIGSVNFVTSSIAFLGVISYSLYLWHQVIYAFYRYTVNEDIAPPHSGLFTFSVFCIWNWNIYLHRETLIKMDKKRQ